VPVDQPCNRFHPCCHPEEFVCSSTTETLGTCQRIPDGTCDPDTEQLCEAEGFKSKCCPKGHQCNPHEKSKTFDCRIDKNDNGGGGDNGGNNGKGKVRKQGKKHGKRGRKRGRKR